MFADPKGGGHRGPHPPTGVMHIYQKRYYVNDNNVIISRISRSIDEVLINVILKDLNDKINSTYKEAVS